MNKFLFTGFALIAVMILASCEGGNDSAKKTKNKDDNESGVGDDDYGTEKSFDGVQLWYTSIITEKEADAMGNYLIESGFSDGMEKTVQLNKSGNTYEFRMVVKTGIEQDQEYAELGKLLATEISTFVFNREPVDVHFCDENFKTLRVLLMSNQIEDAYDERSNQIEDDYDEMSNQIEDDYDEMANQIEDDYNEMANQIEEAYDEMANQIEDAYEVVVLDRSNNSECDEYLAGYEKFMDNYITILKKQQADPSDMSIMTEYMSIMTEGTEWASKTPDCTDMEFLGRLMEIQMKIANAASGMY